MILVTMRAQLNDESPKSAYRYEEGEQIFTDENGWLYVLDSQGLTIGAHHKDHVEGVQIKAGEKTMINVNPPDGNG